MTPSGRTICLAMIVKNEAPVIARCLASVRPLIDHWIVVDTGSTDGTQDIVRAALADLPGALVERPWVDFGTNRSEALQLARPHGDYTLIIDADDEMIVPAGFVMPELTADGYQLDIDDVSIRYRRLQLVRSAKPWRYAGVLHEFLTCEGAGPSGHLPLVMRRNHDGARRREPQTYRRDADILARALETEADPFLIARYTFYLAQSYRDCGARKEALAAYLKRAELGYWIEEVFFSLYQAGRLMEALGASPEQILSTYARASATCPTRAEAAHAASRFCRLQRRFAEGCAIAETALDLEPPPDGLFVERWIYAYGLRDEFAVNAYWANRHRECRDVCLTLLASDALPPGERARVAANLRFAIDRLAEAETSTAKSAQLIARFQAENPIQMEPDEIDLLVQTIRDMPNDGLMVEWGSGASTLRWLQEMRGDQRLIAIEHNEFWYTKVRAVIDLDPKLSRRIKYYLCKSNGYFDHGYGYPAEENPLGLDDYFSPDPDVYHANLFFIDGVARGVCAQMVRAHAIQPDPKIFLHDWYPRRAWYSWSVHLFERHERVGATLCELIGLRNASSYPRRDGAASVAATPARPAGDNIRHRAGHSGWNPGRPLAGTELMVEGLSARMGSALDTVQLCINAFDASRRTGRPLVVWVHHDIDQQAVQWMHDRVMTRSVDCFVFVSDWQRQRYLTTFGLAPERCVVLRNATDVPASSRSWSGGKPLRIAYTSTPFRGLSVLLEAWDRLRPKQAELHVWSSHKLYGPGFDDAPYEALFARASRLPNVHLHGIVPNPELRAALQQIDVLAYPSIFAETSCLAAIEALAAGCRLICSDLGALPETAGRFGRTYAFEADVEAHAGAFAEILAQEIADPWAGRPDLIGEQQRAMRDSYDWSVRVSEWQRLLAELRTKQTNRMGAG